MSAVKKEDDNEKVPDMNTYTSSQRKNEYAQRANRYCIAALIALSFALFVLTACVFLANPTSVIGIVFTCVGVVCALLSMLFFALYSFNLRRCAQGGSGG